MIDLKKLWKNDYFKTALAIVLIVVIIGGFFIGMGLVLGAAVPITSRRDARQRRPAPADDLAVGHPAPAVAGVEGQVAVLVHGQQVVAARRRSRSPAARTLVMTFQPLPL